MQENTLVYHLVIALVIPVVFVRTSRSVRLILSFNGTRIIARTQTALDDRIPDVFLDKVRSILVGMTETFLQFTFIARTSDCTRQADAEVAIREMVNTEFLRDIILMPVPQCAVQMKGNT